MSTLTPEQKQIGSITITRLWVYRDAISLKVSRWPA